MTFRIIKPVISLIGSMLVCMLPISVLAQITLWDTTLIEPWFQTGGGSVTFGTDLIFTGGNNNGGNNVEEFIVDINGQIKRRRIITDTSIVFPTEVGRMKKVINEPYIYGAGVYFLNKFDTSGAIQWSTKYSYPFLQAPFRDFIQLKDKSIVAAGFRQFAGTGWDYFVTRIDSMGNTMWQMQFPHPNDQEALAITEMYDGSLIVGGNDGGKFRILRIGLDGRFIQGYTWPNSTGGNRIRNSAMALLPSKNLITSSDAFNGTLINDHQVIIFDKNLNVLLDTIDDLAPADFIEVNEDSSFYLCGGDENDNVFLFNMTSPYSRLDSLTISLGSNWKFPQSFARINDSSAFLVGIQDNPSPNDYDYWYGRLDGLKRPWIPDPCELSPPRALFSYDYNYPVLTLYDSSYSGLKYHDTVYTWQWTFGNGMVDSIESPVTLWDTASEPTLYVELVISNWYGCTDTVKQTLNFDPSGITMEKALELKVYPNPVSDYLNIEFSETPAEDVIFELFDIQGNKVSFKTFIGKSLRYEIHGLPSGMYFYRITSGMQVKRGKVVKE